MANQSSGKISLIQPHYAALDGLRGVAILMVFLNHYGILFMPLKFTEMLWPGVDLFFVLSGFLITGILLKTKGRPHYFRTFYVRRSLRIFPLYYGFFLLLALLTPILHLHYDRILWSNLLYVSNFLLRHPYVHNPTVAFWRKYEIGFGPLWSLCVEEQFYLAWPAIVWLLPSIKAVSRFCVGAMIAVLITRVAIFIHNPALVAKSHFLYYVTYARCDALFLGALLAAWLRQTKLSFRQTQVVSYSAIGIAASAVVIGAKLYGHHWPENEVNPLLCTYGYTLIDLIAAGFILLAIDERTYLHKVLRNKQLAALGVISYGFYFFHYMPFRSLMEAAGHHHLRDRHLGFPFALLCFTAIYGLAWVSFNLYEEPWLRLKDVLAPAVPQSLRVTVPKWYSRMAGRAE